MIRLYDKNMNLLALLQNAFDIGYDKKANNLWAAVFSLPANDPKNADCIPFNFVEIFEGNDRVDLFRIMPTSFEKNSGGLTNTYTCEHVLATLFDDIMFQYHQITNQSPQNTIGYVLSKQSTSRWQVGTVDFTDSYSYKWENENLFNALFSIAKPYTDEYLWTWNTETYPWTLNLVSPPSDISAYIRYKKNLRGIQKEVDPTNIVTRYYCLGYGEGDNQLTIKSVNNNLPYIDADTISTYGVISDFYIDKSEENPNMLKSKAAAALEKVKQPKICYKVDAADIYQITNESIDKFEVGNLVQVYDTESNIEFVARVLGKSKPDIVGSPDNVQLEISNIDTNKITSVIANMQRKQRVSEVYAQGATNIDSNDYQDNCDAAHPAVIEFYIPDDCVNVNECWLSYKTSKFRAYEKGSLAKDLGTVSISQNTSGQSSTTTSSENVHEHVWGETDTELADGSLGMHKHSLLRDSTWGNTSHSHNIAHTHAIDHSHAIGEHTHDIEYGIFEESVLPTSLTIKVDSTILSITDLQANKVDIVPYLSKDSEGKINRGVFHKIEITPDDLARITAIVVKKIFVQSRGAYSV